MHWQANYNYNLGAGIEIQLLVRQQVDITQIKKKKRSTTVRAYMVNYVDKRVKLQWHYKQADRLINKTWLCDFEHNSDYLLLISQIYWKIKCYVQ